MQLNKAIFVAVYLCAISSAPGLLNANVGQTGSADAAESSGLNGLSAYYGFDQIEIIKLDWAVKDLRIADFNGDGRDDIAVVNNIKAKIELLLQKEALGPGEATVAVDPNDIDVNAISPPTRFEKHSVPVSQKVYSFVCGDLDSDEMIDLAFYGEPRGLYVILQKSSQSDEDTLRTRSWRTRKRINIDDGLLTSDALVCADLNNDGTDDLALAGHNGIYVIVQREDGSLAEPVKYPTTALTLSVEVGDLNADSINDLVLVTNDGEKPIHVRFGLRTGQLGPQVRFFVERPYVFKLSNLDGIVGDEILTVDAVSKRLICYKFAAEDQENTDWPILFYPLASSQGSTDRDLVVGDFTGDGLADIAISDPGAAELVFYKQTAGPGLAEPVRFPAFADIVGLSATDTEGDAKTKLAVLSVKEKLIGISEFEDDRLTFPKPIDLMGEPLAMELADVDSDGRTECVYVSKDANDIRTLRVCRSGAAAISKETALLSTANVPTNSPFIDAAGESGPGLELRTLTSNPDGLKVLDVDQDGLRDVLIFVSYELPILVRQVRRMEFEIVDSPKAQASLIKEARLHSIAVADVDGKAGEELLLAQKNFARSLAFADGRSWSIMDQYNAKSTENHISTVAAFDIGYGSLAGRPAILLLDGQKGQLQILKAGDDNTYRFEKELDVGKWNTAPHLKMLFAPLTGDEAKSILLFDGDKFALVTPPTSGGVRHHLEQQFSYETRIKDGRYGNLTVGDINSDDRVDIIMVEYKRNHIEILTLDHDAKPIPAMRFKIFEEKTYRDIRSPIESSVEPRELKIADVTGDGKDDLVTIIHDRIIVYPQD